MPIAARRKRNNSSDTSDASPSSSSSSDNEDIFSKKIEKLTTNKKTELTLRDDEGTIFFQVPSSEYYGRIYFFSNNKY